jgi:hypothetical protein
MPKIEHTPAVSAIHPAKALLCVGRILYCAPMRAGMCGRAHRLERRARIAFDEAGQLEGATLGQTAQCLFEKLSDERVIQCCMPH